MSADIPTSARARSTLATRQRILHVAVDTLGRDPGASMEDVANAAGVVRRTVYGHFPSREDLVHELVGTAAADVQHAIDVAMTFQDDAAVAWQRFIAEVWPSAARYRALLALRSTDYSPDHRALFDPVLEALAALIDVGQRQGAFTRRLPAQTLAVVTQAALLAVLDLEPALVDRETALTATSLILGLDP